MLTAESTKRPGEKYRLNPADRAEAGIIAVLAGVPRLHHRHSLNLATHLMIEHQGDWKLVLNSDLFLALEYEERLAVLPLAIGEGLATGGDNLRMKLLFKELDPESACPAECRAFTYMSALLAGYLVQRPFYQVERRETEKWLTLATETHFPEIGDGCREAALHRFDPFFAMPDTYLAPSEDPVETEVLSTLVALQTASLRQEWMESADFGILRLAAERFVAVCARRRSVN